MTTIMLFTLMLIGICAGLLSGLVGVGGGIIIVPALMYFLGFSQMQAQGTSLGLLLLPVSLLAVINYQRNGLIDFKVIGILAVAFVLGGWIGSKLALLFAEEVVKKIFAFVLFYSGVKILNGDALLLQWIKKCFSTIHS
jgi:uncharacterized membrane protein YfcA